MPWELKGNCIHKKGEDKPIPGGCHDTPEQAQKHMAALYANEKTMHSAEFVSLIEHSDFVATRAGEPYRLFPFGKLVKSGVEHDITPEYAARFKLPHFKPPIKLGSHDETTPGGGSIVGLEVRADGLYAIPEYVPSGERALADGAYRYQSPEVIWEDGALEDPASGQLIPGPFIVGDALLHTPHMGESAALYSVEIRSKTMETVSVPADLFGKMWAKLFPDKPEPDPKPAPKPDTEPDKLTAISKERDDFKTKYETLAAEQVKREQVSALAVELQNAERFGAAFAALPAATEMAAHIMALPEGEREFFKTKLAALGKQVDLSKITGKTGSGQSDDNGNGGAVESFSAAITAQMKTNPKLNYAEAVQAAAQSKPELYTAWLDAARTGQKGS